VIDFDTPIDAFGVDLMAFSGNFPETATAQIMAADDVTVLDTVGGIALPSDSNSSTPATYVFLGYQHTSGIGSVRLIPTNQDWSPVIDNLTFGQVSDVPEPVTALSLLGLAATSLPRRRRG
jgi:hypothetical protein